MSAIATPMIHSATDGGKAPVPAEMIKDYSALNVPPRTGSGTTQYKIIFTLFNESGSSGSSKREWNYTNQVDRDADMALIQNTISTLVV